MPGPVLKVRLDIYAFRDAVEDLYTVDDKGAFLVGFDRGMRGKDLSPDATPAMAKGHAVGLAAHLESRGRSKPKTAQGQMATEP